MAAPERNKASSSDNPKPEAPGFFSFENLRNLAVLIAIVFALRWSIASPYHVPTASMEPTIKVGDRLLAFKLAYNLKIPFTDFVVAEWGKPKRGDIIVFKYPVDPSIDYVKRVVAVGGDELQLIDDVLYINGEPQPRSDANEDRKVLEDIYDAKEQKLLFREKLAGVDHWVMQNIPSHRHFGGKDWPRDNHPYKIPENTVFAMGDNRDNSADSRVWHEVPLENVRGKALFVLWSFFTPMDSSWPSIRFSRFGEWLQ